MKNMGQRIKELRKMNDLTQEKLADFLGVTYQSVSKWETGVTYPDLSLIVPLAKLLHVTTDELFGMTTEEADVRRAELEDAYFKTGEKDLMRWYDAAKALADEYPDDMKYLKDFAWVEGMRSFEFKNDGELLAAEQEKAIRHFSVVIENCDDEKIKNDAICGITQYLCFRGRHDEAVRYARLLPDNSDVRTKNDVLAYCLTGEKRAKFKQERLMEAFSALLGQLVDFAPKLPALDTAEKLIQNFFPDGNLILYNEAMNSIEFNRARELASIGRNDEAVRSLARAKEFAILSDEVERSNTKLSYTCPFFDKLEEDPPSWKSEGDFYTHLEGFLSNIAALQCFDPLRDREDFKLLLK